jgi:hypothetical protein
VVRAWACVLVWNACPPFVVAHASCVCVCVCVCVCHCLPRMARRMLTSLLVAIVAPNTMPAAQGVERAEMTPCVAPLPPNGVPGRR